MTIIEDPNADARSLMNRAPCVCDGEKTTIPCKHFWSVAQKFRAANADVLRTGEKQRACTLTAGLVLEFTSEEKPTACNRYEARKTPGLVAIVKRAVTLGAQRAGWGYEKFDTGFARFNPLTVEEIEQLRKDNPDRPNIGGMQFGLWNSGASGKMPGSVDDIINGPQIGMLKPGEKMPTLGLSEETEKGLEGIFGDSKLNGGEEKK